MNSLYKETNESLKREIKQLEQKILTLECDVSHLEELNRSLISMIEEITGEKLEFGPIG